MRKTVIFVLVGLCWAAWARADEFIPPKTHPDSSKWANLFAKDLSNAIFPKGIWYWENGELTATKDMNIWTKKEYQNCIIDLEFKNDPGSQQRRVRLRQRHHAQEVDSQLRGDPDSRRLRRQVGERQPRQEMAKVPPSWQCGGIFGRLAPSKQTVKKAGEWNRMTITCHGPEDLGDAQRRAGDRDRHVEVDLRQKNPDGSDIPPWLNKPLAELPTKGHIGLQGKHGGAADPLPQREDQRSLAVEAGPWCHQSPGAEMIPSRVR